MAFSCGDDDIDVFFKKRSFKDHEKNNTRIKSAYHPRTGEYLGFYCLSIALEDENLLENKSKYLVRPKQNKFIALRLDIIAIDKKFQSQGYGTRLLALAVDDFYHLINLVGYIAMILTCSSADKMKFYSDFGFAKYGREVLTPRMFLPAQSVIAAYRSENQTEQNAC
jgi:GNAT superfamily N-acetyltransferase